MKNSILILFLFGATAFAQQNLNQFDANGKRNGYWKVNFKGTQQPKFEGEFEHGQEVGAFKFYQKGYTRHAAAIMQFKPETDSVEVTYYTQKGDPISRGNMVAKQREGKWSYFHKNSDSLMMTEYYKSGKLQGPQTTYFKNGQVAEKTSYKNGQKQGISLVYGDNGQILRKLHFKKDKLEGPAIYYNSKGEKVQEGDYKNGKKTGNWKFYEDGSLNEEKKF